MQRSSTSRVEAVAVVGHLDLDDATARRAHLDADLSGVGLERVEEELGGAAHGAAGAVGGGEAEEVRVGGEEGMGEAGVRGHRGRRRLARKKMVV